MCHLQTKFSKKLDAGRGFRCWWQKPQLEHRHLICCVRPPTIPGVQTMRFLLKTAGSRSCPEPPPVPHKLVEHSQCGDLLSGKPTAHCR